MSFRFYPSFLHITVVSVTLALLLPLRAHATDEEVFEDAREYTVKIRTRVELPFVGDRKGTSTGAGFVVDAARGWILTNAHVAARSPSTLRVAFQGGTFLPAKKLYVDPYLDLAVIALDPKKRPEKLVTASLDCEGSPAIGHPVGAFGHPWELSFTGTRGIVSGVTAKYPGMLEMLQTDAPINPGNSGGPLISLKTGKVLGINTASRRASQNTNFAVPMRHACHVLALLGEGRDPSPPHLPVIFLEDIDETNQLVVARVYDTGGGLREGDIIRGVDGDAEPLRNRGQLLNKLRGRTDDVALRVRRGEAEVTVRGQFSVEPRLSERRGVYSAGVLFAPTPWRDLRDLVGDRLALMVHFVERGSAGDAQRIAKLDLLYSVNGEQVQTVAELATKFQAAAAKDERVKLKFIRIGERDDNMFNYIERTLAVTTPKVIDWK